MEFVEKYETSFSLGEFLYVPVNLKLDNDCSALMYCFQLLKQYIFF